MVDRFKLALAQLNPTVGAVEANLAAARAARAGAARDGAELMLFPELYISGYPPEDLVLKPSFVAACRRAVEAFAAETQDGGPALLVGTPWAEAGAVYNAVALLDGGRVETVRYKHVLPNYGVFDEARVFASGPAPGPVNFRGVRLGVPICEDIWREEVPECLVETGAEILLVPNGSPYERDKPDVRLTSRWRG
jgi:NAD+ synthase